MNILYVITSAAEGGAQKYTLELARHFGGTIAAGGEHRQLFEQAEQLGIPTVRLKYMKRRINPFSDIAAIFELHALIRRMKPGVVHLSSSKAGVIGSIAGKMAGVKTVFTAHGFSFNQPNPAFVRRAYVLAEKFASRYRDMTIAVSAYDAVSALREKVGAPEKLYTVYNGIAPLNFLPRNEARAELGISDSADAFVFGTIAQFYNRKAHDTLLRAIAALKNRKQRFVLIGSGPDEQKMRLLAQKLDIADQVIFAGERKNAWRLLQAFDCFLLPSRIEGFSYALLEAMQAALPIISTRAGGSAEAVADSGIIVNVDDPMQLAEAIRLIAADHNLRRLLAEKAHARSQIFSVKKMLQETAALYSKLASESRIL